MHNKIKKLKNSSRTLAGNCSGVYFLFDKNELVYVGQSWNCLLRVAEHTKKDSAKYFTKWNFIEIENENKRKQVERQYRREFTPKYNKV